MTEQPKQEYTPTQILQIQAQRLQSKCNATLALAQETTETAQATLVAVSNLLKEKDEEIAKLKVSKTAS